LPPILALALCTAFVLILLRYERKQASEISRELWVPTVWLLVTASRPLGTWFGVFGSDPEQSNPLDLAFLVFLIVTAIVILNRRRFDVVGAVRQNKWLIALIVLMLISAFWSDLPDQTLRRAAKELLAVLLAFVVLSEASPRRAMESILRRTTYILIPFSPVLIKYYPQYGRFYTRWSGGEMWTGVATHKNSLAQICIVAAALLIWSLVRRWQGHNSAQWKYQTHAEIVLLVGVLWLLGGPDQRIFYSATSVYALSGGLLVCGGFVLAKKWKITIPASLLVWIVVVIMAVGVVSIFTSGSSLGGFATAAGRDATLTGRTEVWDSLVPILKKNPVLGGGFGVFWTTEHRNIFQISGAHNGYLDVLLGVGFLGLIFLTGFLLSSVRSAYRELSRDFDWGILWIFVLLMLVIHNMGESSVDSFTSYQTAVVLFMTVSSKRMMSTSPLDDRA
jgi:exopolysaccharide production protein ExoQ